ncbi:MAG: hypothetical protein QOH85_1460 [Acidobacteriaceae bacterium]|nr:hypothetical protein [Acidobacteriaceae bacterium]
MRYASGLLAIYIAAARTTERDMRAHPRLAEGVQQVWAEGVVTVVGQLALCGSGALVANRRRCDLSMWNGASWWYSAQPTAASRVLTEEQPTRYRSPWCCAYCAIPRHSSVSTSLLRCSRSMQARPNSRICGRRCLVGSEVELLRAVVAQPATCGHAVLHAVRAYNSPCRLLLDQQVLTDRVVLILVNTARVRRCQTLAPFQVEDAKAQPAGGQPVQLGLCQT